MNNNLITSWSHDYDDYLHDESKRVGAADSISFPTSEGEVVEVIREMRAQGKPVTVQGARTGIVAGSVPQGGHIINLSRMNGIGEVRREGENAYITAQPGAGLDAVREAVAKEDLFFPPRPHGDLRLHWWNGGKQRVGSNVISLRTDAEVDRVAAGGVE